MLDKAKEMIAWLDEHKKSEKEEFDEKVRESSFSVADPLQHGAVHRCYGLCSSCSLSNLKLSCSRSVRRSKPLPRKKILLPPAHQLRKKTRRNLREEINHQCFVGKFTKAVVGRDQRHWPWPWSVP